MIDLTASGIPHDLGWAGCVISLIESCICLIPYLISELQFSHQIHGGMIDSIESDLMMVSNIHIRRLPLTSAELGVMRPQPGGVMRPFPYADTLPGFHRCAFVWALAYRGGKIACRISLAGNGTWNLAFTSRPETGNGT